MEGAKSDTFEAIPPVTPLKVHLREHFAAILQRTRPTGPHVKAQIKPRQYGEVLAADEVIKRIEQQEDERKRKKTEKCTAKKTRARTAQIGQACAQDEDHSAEGIYIWFLDNIPHLHNMKAFQICFLFR